MFTIEKSPSKNKSFRDSFISKKIIPHFLPYQHGKQIKIIVTGSLVDIAPPHTNITTVHR